jgi:hypothetical protein
MRYLTNDYRDSQILNLGGNDGRGPYLVTQTGVDPRAPVPRTHLFVLRPDGCWADFNAYASRGNSETMDEIVFGHITEIMATFGKLPSKPQVAELSVNEEGLEAWLERQKDRPPLEGARAWAADYKKRHPSR